MKRKNVRIIANVNNETGMDIYLNQSGKMVYLMSHRFSDALFNLIKDGKDLESLRREKNCRKFTGNRRTASQRRRSNVLQNTITHVIDVVDTYINEKMHLAA